MVALFLLKGKAGTRCTGPHTLPTERTVGTPTIGFRQRMNREMGAIELTIDVAMVTTELPVTPNPAAAATGPCLDPSHGSLEVRAVNEDNQP